jgi:phosphate transport system substrate-binding protein
MDTKVKAIIAVVAVIVIVGAAAAIVLTNDDDDDKTNVTVQGSTTVNPIMEAVESAYEGLHGDVNINITANGSGAGAAAAIDGNADIAMLSRDLKDSETSSGLVATVIAKDGIAIIINSGVTGVTSLTIQQISDIYDGTITNWSELGGSDATIVVEGRESTSGTRGAFEEILTNTDSSFVVREDMVENASNNALLTSVENTDNAIGYVSLGIALENASDSFTILQVGGVDATIANVVSGDYTLQRNLILATMGEATGVAADIINYVLSAEGQQIVEDNGYIPINSDADAYVSTI